MMSSNPSYDLCVIGGGINGAGIARDAAGRGFSVLLLEAKDLAAATSSASTKLIHGGLRYLEYGQFKLVADSLRERERLLKSAPHIIRPLDIILPHDKTQRPFWMLRMGMFLYDRLGGREILKASRALNLTKDARGKPLRASYTRGFCFSDCWVDDARLVILNAMDASEKGAVIKTRCPVKKIVPEGAMWRIRADQDYTARSLVNAAGPWVRSLLEDSALAGPESAAPHVRLVKGSHIVVPKRYEGEQSYLLQQKDGRVVFVIPYEQDFTLIGTTEEDYEGDPYAAAISEEEIRYLCAAYNEAFEKSLAPEEVKWAYSGVRPLFDDGGKDPKSVTRDYKIHVHRQFQAPLISIFGGKLTTYRTLAEKVVNTLCKIEGRDLSPWTKQASLPGGMISYHDYKRYVSDQILRYDWLPEELLARYMRSYGRRMNQFLSAANGLKDLGESLGEGLYEAEIKYLITREWARSAEDILWRRSKLGLHIADKTRQKLEKKLPLYLKDCAVL